MKKIKHLFIGLLFTNVALADSLIAKAQNSVVKSQGISQYDGITGTAPLNRTISSAGAAFEMLPNGANFYGFFSQTLANDIYYEFRLYSRYNYQTNNPNVPGLPASSDPLPLGFGASGFLGYNFHPNPKVDITPYLRINAYNNMGLVYEDTKGDYLHSNTYALLAGGKLVFKVNQMFAPYINIWGGYQLNNLTGAYPASATQSAVPITGVLNQFAITYEIGLGAKLMDNLFIIPYMGYMTTLNYPDQTAQTAIDQGGLNQTNLPGTSQYFGLKLSAAW